MPATKLPPISEREFLGQIIELAHHLGWRSVHFRPGMNRRGKWSTAVQGDGKGWLDLVLVHAFKGRLIFAEIKTERGKLTPEQIAWIDALRRAGQDAYCWRPSDFERIKEILR